MVANGIAILHTHDCGRFPSVNDWQSLVGSWHTSPSTGVITEHRQFAVLGGDRASVRGREGGRGDEGTLLTHSVLMINFLAASNINPYWS